MNPPPLCHRARHRMTPKLWAAWSNSCREGQQRFARPAGAKAEAAVVGLCCDDSRGRKRLLVQPQQLAGGCGVVVVVRTRERRLGLWQGIACSLWRELFSVGVLSVAMLKNGWKSRPVGKVIQRKKNHSQQNNCWPFFFLEPLQACSASLSDARHLS